MQQPFRVAMVAPCYGRCWQGAGERTPSDVGHTPTDTIDVGRDYIGDDGGDERVGGWGGGGWRLSRGVYIGSKKDACTQVGRVNVRPSPRATTPTTSGP